MNRSLLNAPGEWEPAAGLTEAALTEAVLVHLDAGAWVSEGWPRSQADAARIAITRDETLRRCFVHSARRRKATGLALKRSALREVTAVHGRSCGTMVLVDQRIDMKNQRAATWSDWFATKGFMRISPIFFVAGASLTTCD